MKMAEGRTIVEHLNEFNTVINQLPLVDINFNDEVGPLLIIFSLPKSLDGLIMVLSNSSSSSTLKFDDVVSIILSEKICKKTIRQVSLSGSALNVERI